MDPIQKALLFAERAHAGQVRKYTGVPYIIHPINVAATVTSLPDSTSEMVQAALLHDTVEDTDTTFEDIVMLFGSKVAMMVHGLTDASLNERFKEWNRERRKAIDRKQLASCSAEVQTIKMADMIDNSPSILAFAPGFAKIYMDEKRALFEVLTKGDKSLRDIAGLMLANYFGKPK